MVVVWECGVTSGLSRTLLPLLTCCIFLRLREAYKFLFLVGGFSRFVSSVYYSSSSLVSVSIVAGDFVRCRRVKIICLWVVERKEKSVFVPFYLFRLQTPTNLYATYYEGY